MKKIIFAAIMLLLFAECAYASDDYDGYIVHTAEGFLSVADADDTVTVLSPSEGLYLTDEQTARDMLASGLADYIEPDYKVELFDTPNDTYYSNQKYLTSFGFEHFYDMGFDGSGAVVGIVDSGAYTDAEDLGDMNISGYRVYSYRNTTKTDSNFTYDNIDHGTGVTSIMGAPRSNSTGIAGIAPNAEYAMINVFETSDIYVSRIITGLELLYDNYEIDALNLSFGVLASAASGIESTSSSLYKELKKFYDDGVIIVCSAGNYGATSYATEIAYPAGYDITIAVGSVTSSGTRSSFASYNSSVDFTMCGSSVYLVSSGYTDGDTAKYKTTNGTSFTAPQVTALAAVARSVYPDITQDEFYALLQESCVDAGDDGWDAEYGWGIVRFDLFADNLTLTPIIDTSDDTLSVTFEENTALAMLEKQSPIYYVGVYDTDGTLLHAFASEDYAAEYDCSVPEDADVRLFVWDENMVPIYTMQN